MPQKIKHAWYKERDQRIVTAQFHSYLLQRPDVLTFYAVRHLREFNLELFIELIRHVSRILRQSRRIRLRVRVLRF